MLYIIYLRASPRIVARYKSLRMRKAISTLRCQNSFFIIMEYFKTIVGKIERSFILSRIQFSSFKAWSTFPWSYWTRLAEDHLYFPIAPCWTLEHPLRSPRYIVVKRICRVEGVGREARRMAFSSFQLKSL